MKKDNKSFEKTNIFHIFALDCMAIYNILVKKKATCLFL